MCVADFGETWCKAMDRAIASVVNRKRHMMGLLAPAYLHQQPEDGGVGLKSVAALQVYHIVFAVQKSLNSPDRQ
jgi:hypothetical protein